MQQQEDGLQNACGSAWEIFRVFLALGLTSFGGPIAHIGYFRREFVVRRRWTDESTFADLVALGQFLPGPASSQVGFAIGLTRAGWQGGLAAWCGFTLPSALLLFAFFSASASLHGDAAASALHGLKLVAVAVVAQAVWGMARMLTPDLRRIAIAVAGAATVFFVGGAFGEIAAILLGGAAGLLLCQGLFAPVTGRVGTPVSPAMGAVLLAAFVLLLLGLPLVAGQSHMLAVFEAFYRSGALVFGGGHVVLPLLNDALVAPNWIAPESFLAGYGAAQAVPGPLFTVAAYLGAGMTLWPNGAAGAAVALAGIFLPGLLVMAGALPFWDRFRTGVKAQAMMRGVNAAVVGLLAAALYDPLWKYAVLDWTDVALVLAGLGLLTVGKAPPLLVVVFLVVAAMAAGLLV
jgi:chromate transporter